MAQSCQARFTAPVHGTASPFLPLRHTAHAYERHRKWAGFHFDAPADTGCPVLVARSWGRFPDRAQPPKGWQYFSVGLCLSFSASVYFSFSAVLVFVVRSVVFGIAHTNFRDYADSQTVEQYLSHASASTSPCSLRTMSSACTVFSSESKLPSHGADHQVHASPHVPSVKTTAGADASPGYVASPSRVATFVQSTSSSSLLFLSPPSPFLVSPGRSRSCRRRKRPFASLRQRGNDGGKAVSSGSGIAVASGRGLVRLRLLCHLFVGRKLF